MRVECTHARSTTMKDCRAAAGQPSWLTSARAPNTQPRNADFLVAIAPYLFITPFPDSLPRFYPPPSRSLFFPVFSLFPRRRTHRRRQSCADVSRFSCETKRDTPPSTCKMAEFNRKALFTGRSWRGSRSSPPIFITLIFILFSYGDCERRGCLSTS